MDSTEKKLNPLLGETIRRCRMYLEMSISEFAHKIGRQPSFVRQLEQSQIEFSMSLLKDCAKALDISVEELFEFAAGDCDLLVMGDITEVLAEAV